MSDRIPEVVMAGPFIIGSYGEPAGHGLVEQGSPAEAAARRLERARSAVYWSVPERIADRVKQALRGYGADPDPWKLLGDAQTSLAGAEDDLADAYDELRAARAEWGRQVKALGGYVDDFGKPYWPKSAPETAR